MQPEVEVEVEVASPDPEPAADTTVVVVDTPAPAPAPVPTELLVSMGERLMALEAAVSTLADQVSHAQVTADIAQIEVEHVAQETEEAVAELAQEADAATTEVQAEIEDIAPNREHPWFAKRSILGRGGDT